VQLSLVNLAGRRDGAAARRAVGTFRRLAALAAVVLALAVAQVPTRPPVLAPSAAAAASSIEAGFSPVGRYAVTAQVLTDVSGSTPYKIFRPADYSALGFASPIVTWGNGTNGTVDLYSVLLSHLASYGFTVIAPDQANTGSGRAMTAGVQYLIAQAGTAGSVFQGRLDVNSVAALGHSQGAGGAVRAATNNPTLFDTVVTFSLPNKMWIGTNSDCPTKSDCTFDPAQLRQPTFLAGTHGTIDSIITSISTEQAFYQQVPGHAVLGLIQNSAGKKADHNTIQDRNGPNGFLGYVTAWLCAQLRGDATAATAFGGAHPELVSNTNWPDSAAK